MTIAVLTDSREREQLFAYTRAKRFPHGQITAHVVKDRNLTFIFLNYIPRKLLLLIKKCNQNNQGILKELDYVLNLLGQNINIILEIQGLLKVVRKLNSKHN